MLIPVLLSAIHFFKSSPVSFFLNLTFIFHCSHPVVLLFDCPSASFPHQFIFLPISKSSVSYFPCYRGMTEPVLSLTSELFVLSVCNEKVNFFPKGNSLSQNTSGLSNRYMQLDIFSFKVWLPTELW